ncbi:DegT/DnrJ/EryC1/StrS family aminotransferase, partial [Desulfobacula sp.]|nr:UDP-4-amino-4,6-dideoxy-N-acetyl-beta-L-altrosamine transaminase [Desulfobacula sp.]
MKAVIATDYAGQPCDWRKLKSLSKKYKFYLINDNCHAIGAKY